MAGVALHFEFVAFEYSERESAMDRGKSQVFEQTESGSTSEHRRISWLVETLGSDPVNIALG
jgi:hypothetical protein